ncbi:hypothetical protein ACOTD8_11425 [Achromobacter dolens]|uniref:hypothetical protein n=1 Tax=Achromobacter dolens TaxID=1287738 RepID=UPI003B99B46D
MRCLSLGFGLLFFSCLAQAEMIRNDAIGNDPQKEKLCASRAQGKTVPFEIDSRYIKSARSYNPDATFIAIDGISPQLVECHLRQGTGKYEPASFSPEGPHWRLLRPKQFEPGIDTAKGKAMAAKVCIDAAPAKINRPNLDHSVYSNVIEIGINGPRYRAGASIAGKKAERYDIAVEGTSFYKSAGPDLAAVTFTCLLSPTLAIKGIEFK